MDSLLSHLQKSLTPKLPRVHGFKLTNAIDHIVKNIIQMGPNFISLESVKNFPSVGQKINKIGQKEVPYDLRTTAKKMPEIQLGLLCPFGVQTLLGLVFVTLGYILESEGCALQFSNILECISWVHIPT